MSVCMSVSMCVYLFSVYSAWDITPAHANMDTADKWVCLKFVSKDPNPSPRERRVTAAQIKEEAFFEARAMRRMSCWCGHAQCAHVVKLISFHEDVIFPHYEGRTHDAPFYVFVMVRVHQSMPYFLFIAYDVADAHLFSSPYTCSLVRYSHTSGFACVPLTSRHRNSAKTPCTTCNDSLYR
jgi:hypothetical protein